MDDGSDYFFGSFHPHSAMMLLIYPLCTIYIYTHTIKIIPHFCLGQTYIFFPFLFTGISTRIFFISMDECMLHLQGPVELYQLCLVSYGTELQIRELSCLGCFLLLGVFYAPFHLLNIKTHNSLANLRKRIVIFPEKKTGEKCYT
jgi:hypothetical protein